jgi:hypothetical protein
MPLPKSWSLSLLALMACGSPDPQKDGTTPDPEPHTGTPTTTAESASHSAEVPPVELADFALSVDPDMVLMVHATFTDPGAEDAWVEYRFESEAWLVAPTISTGVAVLLGIPQETMVEARAVAVVGGVTLYSEPLTATTGPLPPPVLQPGIVTFEEGLASPEGYAMISMATGDFTFEAPYVIEVFDRRGRVVWYRQVPDELFSFYPSVSRDGTHIWFDAEDIFGFARGPQRVTRQTLDGRWVVEHLTPDAGQAYGEGPDDSFFYELRGQSHGIMQVDAAGGITQVWDCDAHMASIGRPSEECQLNATNWDETRGTVLASQFSNSTVFEVDLSTGLALRQFGALEEGDPYTFVPPESNFAYQHWPHWTPEGTLMTSTHIPCDGEPGCFEMEGQHGTQIAAEYVVDDVAKTITRVWSHVSTDRWATQIGEAYRLSNGNLIQGYGQDGAVREITPDGETAWEVIWLRDRQGYRALGHLTLIDDLYALNRGH